jgi:urea transporter
MGIRKGWNSLVEKNVIIRFIDTLLRGSGQVFFQNNPITGLFFLAAIWYGAFVAHDIPVGIGALVGLVVSTITAYVFNSDRSSLQQGLFGFNGILLGIALPTFLGHEGLMWVYLVVGAILVQAVYLALSNLLKTWGVGASTGPFVLTTWILLLGAYYFAKVPVASMGPPALPQSIGSSASHLTISFSFLWNTFFKNIAQVFFINNAISGILILIGLFISTWLSGVFAMVASGVAMLVAIVAGANATSIANGLFGFSAVLTGIALGCVFLQPSWRVAFYAILGIIFTVFVQAALDVYLAPVGIPTLTAPYVVVMYLFVLAMPGLKPKPHLENVAKEMSPSKET